MNQDIGDLLNDWPFDPNEFAARRITVKEGSEKLQIRMDLGIKQQEVEQLRNLARIYESMMGPDQPDPGPAIQQ